MGYSTTYTGLRNEILSITDSDNPELIDNLDRIIARAQDNVQRDLSLEFWRTIVTVTLTAGSKLLARQLSWLKVTGIFVAATETPVERRTPDYLRAYGAATGIPRYYAEQSEGHFRVAPVPVVDTDLEIDALTRLPTLSNSLQTNWISANAADLLLLQALIGAEAYLLGEEKSGVYAQMYSILLASAKYELRGIEKAEAEPIRSAPRPDVENA